MPKLRKFIRFQSTALKAADDWQRVAIKGISGRRYASYDDYLEVQASKLEYLDLTAHERRFRTALRQRLENLDFVHRGQNVLCLGARLGAEVRAFIDLGCFAVGLDLNPGPRNRYVMYGDFHDLPMPDASVDILYSNSIDHAFELKGMVSEMVRVLSPEGHIILEPDPGPDDIGGIKPDLWAAQRWSTIDILVNYLENLGIVLVARRPFEYPRSGQQLVFRLVGPSGS